MEGENIKKLEGFLIQFGGFRGGFLQDFESIFSRQLEAIGQKGDLLIGISTSGLSKNINKAIMQAKKMNISTFGLFGQNITKIKRMILFAQMQ